MNRRLSLIIYNVLSVGDIFNTIYHDLFYDIYKIKWLIFQGTFANPDHDQIYIEIFNEIIEQILDEDGVKMCLIKKLRVPTYKFE